MTQEEKLKKVEEALDSFINKIAQRAEASYTVNQVMERESNSSKNLDSSSSNGWGTHSFDDWDTSSSEVSDDWDTSQTSNTVAGVQSTSVIADNYYEDEEDDEVVVNAKKTIDLDVEGFKQAWVDAIKSTKEFYDNERIKNKVEEERRSQEQPKQCTSEIMFKKNTTTFNGKPYEYKVLQKEVNWGSAFTKSFTMDDKITNLDKLNEKIIEDIKLTFGDLSRITEVAVVSGMLIINGVQYYPLCKDKDFLEGLPFDCVDYFKSGAIAELFDFGYLYYMPYLTTLKIDSVDFVVKKFAYDVGVEGVFKPQYAFKCFTNLKYFELADSLFVAPGRDVNGDKEKTTKLNERIEHQSKIGEVYDKYVAKNADAFTSWTFNNMKTYACNSGKKGFFHYTGGVLARAGMATVVGAGNLSLKAISGTIKGVAKLIKNALDDDI